MNKCNYTVSQASKNSIKIITEKEKKYVKPITREVLLSVMYHLLKQKHDMTTQKQYYECPQLND